MSPAFEAAMQTTVPTVRMAARADGSRQPQSTKTTETPSSVTRVMADVGFDDTPMRPTMRDDTTTKATPNTATPMAATRRGTNDMWPASNPGTATSVTMTISGTSTTTQEGMSRSVRSGAWVPGPGSRVPVTSGPVPVTGDPRPASPRRPRSTAANELHI